MKIVITGGLGFIGSHLSDLLSKQNHQIILVSKSLRKKANIPNNHINKYNETATKEIKIA